MSANYCIDFHDRGTRSLSVRCRREENKREEVRMKLAKNIYHSTSLMLSLFVSSRAGRKTFKILFDLAATHPRKTTEISRLKVRYRYHRNLLNFRYENSLGKIATEILFSQIRSLERNIANTSDSSSTSSTDLLRAISEQLRKLHNAPSPIIQLDNVRVFSMDAIRSLF